MDMAQIIVNLTAARDSLSKDLSCGASACALGMCPSIPEFFSLGLRLRLSTKRGYIALTQEGVDSTDFIYDSWGHSAKTAAAFFGLTPQS